MKVMEKQNLSTGHMHLHRPSKSCSQFWSRLLERRQRQVEYDGTQDREEWLALLVQKNLEDGHLWRRYSLCLCELMLYPDVTWNPWSRIIWLSVPMTFEWVSGNHREIQYYWVTLMEFAFCKFLNTMIFRHLLKILLNICIYLYECICMNGCI